jgi:hypothetical protein
MLDISPHICIATCAAQTAVALVADGGHVVHAVDIRPRSVLETAGDRQGELPVKCFRHGAAVGDLHMGSVIFCSDQCQSATYWLLRGGGGLDDRLEGVAPGTASPKLHLAQGLGLGRDECLNSCRR